MSALDKIREHDPCPEGMEAAEGAGEEAVAAILAAETWKEAVDLAEPHGLVPYLGWAVGRVLDPGILRRADLRRADLGGADLRRADLQGANLQGANLRRADLRRADLGGANLRRADLRRADLGGADLGGVYLGGADLGGVYLGGADLRGAYLGGADLTRTRGLGTLAAEIMELRAEVAKLREAADD